MWVKKIEVAIELQRKLVVVLAAILNIKGKGRA